ncbi:hypothetical protein [Cohnella sp. AR92]|uniref:hypothetical protein n=1 Tax=Cohnella sp. AR92 TaxID=648716 RepID=UPI000F8CC05E|nr:hypothetical protein [Cohnella sp. AR92]RUS48377.1 hypothetical protein ELR57_02860 [Cohnella sp. AR92]
MSYRIAAYLLCAVLIVGIVRWCVDEKNENERNTGAHEFSQATAEPTDSAEVIDGLKSNLENYLKEYDGLLNQLKPVLPVMTFSNEEQRQVLEEMKSFLDANTYIGKPILRQGEIVVSLEIQSADSDSRYAVRVYTYEDQQPRVDSFPSPVDIHLGRRLTMGVRKAGNTWEVTDIQ